MMMLTTPITREGLENIARHQYRAGSYSRLDKLLDPLWIRWTEDYLPPTLAANTVTSLGGLFCMTSYILTWFYSPNLKNPIPNWVHVVNALCLAIYYTLDCMDGKQARRTGTSSPLGQLWDHGIDCVCLLSHVSTVMAWLLPQADEHDGATSAQLQQRFLLVGIQSSLQFVWFVAQWEEYYTGVLMHSTGPIGGITELTYGLALVTFANACIIDRSVYSMPVASVLFKEVGSNPLIERLGLHELQLKHCLAFGWYCIVCVWVLLSISRVVKYLQEPRRCLEALTKLTSPTILLVVPVLCLPESVLEHDTRYILLTVGLAFCLISIKLIVFGMAKQAYAAFQLDCVPVLAVTVWTQQQHTQDSEGITRLLWQCTSVWYLVRLIWWVYATTMQICQRLDIAVFRIKRHDG